MDYTQEQLVKDGFLVPPAPPDAWRAYDERHPVPNYFDFDWLSARHPDLYHRFALSSIGLMQELERLVDLSGLQVLDVGAGTGRSACAAARRARRVVALDAYASVTGFGAAQARQAGLTNLAYLRGNRDHLPFAASSFDALVNSWAELNLTEAYRLLKPGGLLIRLGAPLEALCGELTATLASAFPHLIQSIAPADWFEPGCPVQETRFLQDTWEGLPVLPPVLRHDFTYVADYSDPLEASAIFGRFYGPPARDYFLQRRQAQFAWRLRIEICRVLK